MLEKVKTDEFKNSKLENTSDKSAELSLSSQSYGYTLALKDKARLRLELLYLSKYSNLRD